MKKCARITGIIFGVMMISLSFLVTIETIIRKLFSISMGGVDELSGYAIAIGALLALVVTSIEQAHIRINLLYLQLSKLPQALLNFVSSISIAALALFFSILHFWNGCGYLDISLNCSNPLGNTINLPPSSLVCRDDIFCFDRIHSGHKSNNEIAPT